MPAVEVAGDPALVVEEAPVEMEVTYTFTWAPVKKRPQHTRPETTQPVGKRPEGQRRDKGKGKPGQRGPKGGKYHVSKPVVSRPERIEKPIDPDNPFAALMALKGKT